jgi:hypothetical protein
MLNKTLCGALLLQICVLAAMYNSKPEPTKVVAIEKPEEVKPLIEAEVKEDELPVEKVELKALSKNEFNFVIPERRVITEMGAKGLISINKEVNLMGTLGEAFMDNPLVQMSMEKRSRKMLQNFFADFIKDANLSPEEQLALFQVLGDTMQANMRSLMAAMGENMELMKNMRKDGLVPELTQGIKENNVAMREELNAQWGDEKSQSFQDFHQSQSLTKSMGNINNKLKGDDKFTPEQNQQVEKLLESRYRSPFEEDSYDQSFPPLQDDEFPEDFTQKQRQAVRSAERRNNGLFLAF